MSIRIILGTLSADNITCSPIADLVKQRNNVLPFGKIYFDTLRSLTSGETNEKQETAVVDSFPDDRIIIPTNITGANIDKFSLYDVLGLGSWGSSADKDAIKKAYHKAVLVYHPDKKMNASEEDKRVFLKIQEAFNTLTNEGRRRAYDSQLDFDESIPSDKDVEKAIKKKGSKGFYDLFDPVFKRNARFAEVKPVPDIGDENTPIDTVYSFYDYWIKFDSWRDFSTVGAEHKPEDATCREEKRWMTKENERNAKKLKKKEIARITELTMRAMERDPRIIADKNESKIKKEAAKAAKEDEARKRAAEDEAAKKWAEEQEAAAVEYAKASKQDKEKLKKLQSKARNLFRKLLRQIAESNKAKEEYGIFSSDDVEFLCMSIDLMNLSTLNDTLGGEAATKTPSLINPAGQEEVSRALESAKSIKEAALAEEKEAKQASKLDAASRANAATERKKKGLDREWTKDEYSALSKALGKFPAGTRQRWVTISNYMNDQMKPVFPFEMEECMRAAHNAIQNMTLFKDSKAATGKVISPVASELSTAASLPSTTIVDSSSVLPTPPPPLAQAPSAVTTATASQEWSPEQQKALESGLVKFPASMEKAERWKKIADQVPGKSKQDCIARYKQLASEVQAKRTG